MNEPEDRMASLNPYQELTVVDSLALIKIHKIDVSLCFFDEGLPESRFECDAVNEFFKVAEPYLCSEYSQQLLSSFPIFDEEVCEGKNILVWLATHFDGDDFIVQWPQESRWNSFDLFQCLSRIGLSGYSDLFVFFNVCYSKAYSDLMWASFVDMQSGMTVSAAAKHFFVHKNMTPILDKDNAAQAEIRAMAGDCSLESGTVVSLGPVFFD